MRAMQRRRKLHHAKWRNLSCVRTQQLEELRLRSETASCLEEASSPRAPVTAAEGFRATIGVPKVSFVGSRLTIVIRWEEKAGLRTGCGVRSQVIDVLRGTDKKETGNEEG